MRVLSPALRLRVLHLLIEGNSIRSTERLTGVHRDTIMKLLVYAGNYAGDFLYQCMRGLRLSHIQVDEIWTFVEIKQAHIPEDRAGDVTIGDQYVFVAIDEHTKVIPTFLVGKRTAPNAERFMLDLSGRVRAPRPGEPKIRLQISTDGFAAYPGAVDLAFAQTVDYGVIIKQYGEDRREEQVGGRYAPSELSGTERRVITGNIDGFDL